MSDALLQQLLDAGTPPLLVAKVAAELARAEERASQSREPTKGALRMRAYRERHPASQNVTSDASDAQVTESVTSPPTPNKSPPDPQKLTPTPPPPPTRARTCEAFPRPDWADAQVWSDLLANRRRKGLAGTATAHRKLLADIDRLTDDAWPPGRILEAAVSRGWGAIYGSIKDDDGDGRRAGTDRMAGNGRGRSATGFGATGDAMVEFVAGAPH
ncbi:hypothetical protein [Sphingomonas sp.]|uniref:hypothetical protein n=1 Tax=Sphingomonas sp. TaxID=28214 RepID=UPI003B00F0B8